MKTPLSESLMKAHSEQLIQLIKHEILTGKKYISFAQFMQLALYAPGLGYYSAGAHKLGKQGDFITSPEISPLFAQCLATQCQQILHAMGGGDILELGAGTGKLAKELLLTLEKSNTLPNRYLILEVSADLRERQQTLLKNECPHLFSRIHWLDTLEEISGIIIANEVLDALPVNCFQIENNKIVERSVAWQDNQFIWELTEPSTTLSNAVELIQTECDLPNHYQSEINLLLPAWLTSIENTLKQGVLLFFDYGYGCREYYHPDRSQGTLMCYYQHQKQTDPFAFIGLQDITAHVNFTQVVETAMTAGLRLGGYTTQAAFLFACGLLELADNPSLSAIDQALQNRAIKTLTLPSEMGEAIKVMGLLKNMDLSLTGFSLHDRRRDL
jgi:SAM-dependent MidA family methyltransferase